MKWWSLRSPNLVSFSAEQPEGKGRVTSLTSVYGEVITGDSIGELYIWKVRHKANITKNRLINIHDYFG